MQDTQVGASVISWVTDYFIFGPQFVRLRNCVSQKAVGNIVAPQGTVLFPFPFTLYTLEFPAQHKALSFAKVL